MARITLNRTGLNTFLLGESNPVNGSYRLPLEHPAPEMSIQFIPFGLTSGTATLSVDGQAGDSNTVALTSERIRKCSFSASFIDVDIAGANAGAKLIIFVR